MEIGPYILQIAVTLAVIVGAAVVALLCDFLKGNNEQLRELTLELKVRREEENKRYRMTSQGATTPQAIAAALQAMMPQATSGMAAAPARPVTAQPVTTQAAAAPVETAENKARRAPSQDAITAMDRGEQLATMRRLRNSDRAAAAASTASMIDNILAARAAKKAEAVAASPAVRATAKSAAPITVDVTPAVPEPAPIPAGFQACPPIPAGFQDGFVLSNLVKNHQPVSGLVVSIGVNAPKDAKGDLPEAVKNVIRDLLGPDDFAAQTSADEFLLIMPKEHGAAAQRRLSHLAQQLWDFQLRSLGKYAILFSWGGVEVERESIDEAIASANERMQETKRGRKVLTMESRQAPDGGLRKAV